MTQYFQPHSYHISLYLMSGSQILLTWCTCKILGPVPLYLERVELFSEGIWNKENWWVYRDALKRQRRFSTSQTAKLTWLISSQSKCRPQSWDTEKRLWRVFSRKIKTRRYRKNSFEVVSPSETTYLYKEDPDSPLHSCLPGTLVAWVTQICATALLWE